MLTYLQTSIKFDKTEKTKKNALVYKKNIPKRWTCAPDKRAKYSYYVIDKRLKYHKRLRQQQNILIKRITKYLP